MQRSLTALTIACVIAACLSNLAYSADVPRGLKKLPDDHPMHEANHTLAQPIPFVADITPKFFDKYITPQKKSNPKRHWIVLFYTRWCHICDEFVDPLTEISADLHSNDLKFAKVDVTENHAPAHRFNIEAFPTLIAIHKSDLFSATVFEGPRTAETMRKWIADVLRDDE